MIFRTVVLSVFATVASLDTVYAKNDRPQMGRGDARWEGPVWPDQPDQTLWVTSVDDLWDQVLKLNPTWIEYIPVLDEVNHDYGTRFCGANSGIATGHSEHINELLTRLRALGGYWTLDAQQCFRLGCRPNAGVYWCNNNKWSIRTSAQRLFLHGTHAADMCCQRKDGSALSGDPISGMEMFPDNDNEAAHSTVTVGYGDCAHARSVDPLIYYPYPGTMGVCLS